MDSDLGKNIEKFIRNIEVIDPETLRDPLSDLDTKLNHADDYTRILKDECQIIVKKTMHLGKRMTDKPEPVQDVFKEMKKEIAAEKHAENAWRDRILKRYKS